MEGKHKYCTTRIYVDCNKLICSDRSRPRHCRIPAKTFGGAHLPHKEGPKLAQANLMRQWTLFAVVPVKPGFHLIVTITMIGKWFERQTGSGVQNQVYGLSSYLYWGDWQKLEDKTDRTQTGDQERWYQESHFWTPSTKHKIDWDSAECVTYTTNYQRLTLESWARLFESWLALILD